MKESKFGKLVVQFFKFGLVGLVNTGLSWLTSFVVTFLLTMVASDTLAVNIGNAAGFLVGVVNSYCLNKRFVFKNRQETSETKTFAKTFICYGATFLLSMLLMNGLLAIDGFKVVLFETDVTIYAATMLRLLVTIPLNFIANKLWAYKDR